MTKPIYYVSDMCEVVCVDCITKHEATHMDQTYAILTAEEPQVCEVCGYPVQGVAQANQLGVSPSD